MALGMPSRLDAVSAKIGRIRSVQPGLMAGAGEPRRADRIPATKVPCRQAALPAWVQLTRAGPGNLSKMSTGEIGMLKGDGAVDEPDLHFGLTGAARHERSQIDQVQSLHGR